MELLYSDILPLALEDGQTSIIDSFHEQIALSDRVEIAVGYVSKAALEELDSLVYALHLKYVSLVIGMYYIEGMPESTYRTALALNEKWKADGIGEIRLVKAFKYHGKLHAFLKDDSVYSAIIGSANLGVMLMYGKVSQENYVELTAASAIPNKEIKSPQILRY